MNAPPARSPSATPTATPSGSSPGDAPDAGLPLGRAGGGGEGGGGGARGELREGPTVGIRGDGEKRLVGDLPRSGDDRKDRDFADRRLLPRKAAANPGTWEREIRGLRAGFVRGAKVAGGFVGADVDRVGSAWKRRAIIGAYAPAALSARGYRKVPPGLLPLFTPILSRLRGEGGAATGADKAPATEAGADGRIGEFASRRRNPFEFTWAVEAL